MKYKVSCKYRLADEGRRYLYKSNDLPTGQWMEDNIGKNLIDWICYSATHTHRVIIEFKDEDKMILFILKCGDNIEQV